ncbi:MAG: Clp protease ClpP [Gammaproteobacteria bacterium]|nr:Clp protease ClpP [Gammaproteobacteria bacterium]
METFTIYDMISAEMARSVVEGLRAKPRAPVTVCVNSWGGDAGSGLAIYNALAAHPGQVTVRVEGLCASAATLICCAGHTVALENTVFALHDPYILVEGNAAKLREYVEALERYSTAYAQIYAQKTGRPIEEISAYMKRGDTWLSAKEAKEFGIVDEVVNHPCSAALCLGPFQLPARFAMYKTSAPSSTVPPVPPAAPVVASSPVMSANAIADACTAAGEPNLAKALLDRPYTEAQLQARLLEAREIRNMAAHLHLEGEAEPILLAGIHPDRAIHLLWKKDVERDQATPINSAIGAFRTTPYGGHADFVQAASDALAARMGANLKKAHPAARDFQNTSLTGMAALCLNAAGQNPIGMSRPQLVKAAMTTSDFPHLLSAMANKSLTDRFEELSQQHRALCDRADLPDFKTHQAVNVSFLPGLELKREAGEIKYAALSDGAESYKLATYARGLTLSREAIINDDLQAFASLIHSAAHASSRLERDLVFGVLTANAAMSDSTALFHADHGNLDTSSAAVAIAGLNKARVLMRKQQDSSGGFVLTQPKYIVCPVAVEGDADAVITSVSYRPASDTEQTTPKWVSQLAVVSDPRLDLVDADDWYLLSDPHVAPVLRLAYLNGIFVPEVQEELDFDRDVVKYKVRFDVACAAIGWAGAVKMA